MIIISFCQITINKKTRINTVLKDNQISRCCLETIKSNKGNLFQKEIIFDISERPYLNYTIYLYSVWQFFSIPPQPYYNLYFIFTDDA